MNRKWLKRIFTTLVISIPIVPIFVLMDYTRSSNAIFTSGSSSVLPLMQKFSKEYTKSQVVPTGGGSGKGLEDAANGNTDFGAMSSNKKSSILGNSDLKADWIKNKNKTITIARDAIVIALHIPPTITGYKARTGIDGTEYPYVRPWAIAEMYSKGNAQVKWSNLLENAVGPGVNNIIKAYGRNGGKAASGTSDGFFNTLKEFASYAKPKIDLDFNHQSNKIIKTPESNSQAYSRLNSSKAYGVTYLSLGYLENILKSHDPNNNIKPSFVDVLSGNTSKYTNTASYKDVVDNWWLPTIENATSEKYKWTRPFNLAYSLNNYNKNTYIRDFITWMLNPNEGQLLVTKMNLVVLNPTLLDHQEYYIHKTDNYLANASKTEQQFGYGYQGPIAGQKV